MLLYIDKLDETSFDKPKLLRQIRVIDRVINIFLRQYNSIFYEFNIINRNIYIFFYLRHIQGILIRYVF